MAVLYNLREWNDECLRIIKTDIGGEAMSAKEKTGKKGWKIFLRILLGVLVVIVAAAAIITILNFSSVNSSEKFISQIKKVDMPDQLVPEKDKKDGYYTFRTDDDLKVMQLTDVHLGGGFLSRAKDKKTLNAVAAMVTAEKPDLVIVTGDIDFPSPPQSGSVNTKSGARLFADLMEKLGVYWAPAFGNHDSEAHTYYSRKDIADFYSNKERYPHCLFQSGPENVDGYGNYIIKEVNSKGKIVQFFVLLDSGSYINVDSLVPGSDYDCVHKNQVEWYKKETDKLTAENGGAVPKSLMFFHIPPKEMLDAYNEYTDNGNENTDRVQYLYGDIEETDKIVYCSDENYGLFDAVKEKKSTKAIFFGHDHVNTASFLYDGIQLSYGLSVDYLAYADIQYVGPQRGCTIITVDQKSGYVISQKNYYQDKYVPVAEKEKVSMKKYRAYMEDKRDK